MKNSINYMVCKRVFSMFEMLVIFITGMFVGEGYAEARVFNDVVQASGIVIEEVVEIKPAEDILEPMALTFEEEPIKSVIFEPEYSLTQEEIELIALVVMAEAEGEPVEGQRLVIDTILNRVDGKYWPNTVEGVIYQKNQFSSMWNGRVDRCYIKPELVDLVKEELVSRLDNEVVFFRTQRYSDYGVPKRQVCCHYFSTYN